MAQSAGDQVYKPGEGVTAPTVVKDVKPNYTPDAMRRRVQGLVGMSCVVKADGNVGDCTVTRPLDDALDQEALRVVKQWQFKPGMKDGQPVAVEVSIEMSFTLRDGPPVFRPGAEVSSPAVIREVKPEYPADVMREGIQGTVELEGIVQSTEPSTTSVSPGDSTTGSTTKPSRRSVNGASGRGRRTARPSASGSRSR